MKIQEIKKDEVSGFQRGEKVKTHDAFGRTYTGIIVGFEKTIWHNNPSRGKIYARIKNLWNEEIFSRLITEVSHLSN